MQVPSVLEMSTKLKSDLETVVDLMLENRRTTQALESFGISVKHNCRFPKVFETAMRNYFESICRQLTLAYANGTPAQIGLFEGLYTFTGRYNDDNSKLNSELWGRLCQINENDQEGLKNAVQEVIAAVPFEQIHNSLSSQIKQLSNVGLGIIARQYMSTLRLLYRDNPMVVTSRHVILSLYVGNGLNAYDRLKEIQAIMRLHGQVAQMAGIDFGTSLAELKVAVNRLDYWGPGIASRTTFGKGTHLEIVCFKTRYEFRYSRQAFDAVSAYLSIYSQGDAQDKWAAHSSQIQFAQAS